MPRLVGVDGLGLVVQLAVEPFEHLACVVPLEVAYIRAAYRVEVRHSLTIRSARRFRTSLLRVIFMGSFAARFVLLDEFARGVKQQARVHVKG